jgi:hypothetical protein
MKRLPYLSVITRALALGAILLIAGAMGCSSSTSTSTTSVTYKLTHNLADLDYIISWDTIAARIPDMNDPAKYDILEGFVARGNSGGFINLDSNSPAMWLIARSVMKKTEGNSSHIFGVWMWFFETEKELDEHIKTAETQGISVQKEGDFLTAFIEAQTPVQSEYMLLAGNQICVLIAETASPDESLFFDKEQLMELLPIMKSKISSIVITPLPWPRIPRN